MKSEFIDAGDGTCLVPLTQGKHAIVSREDAERVCRYKWCAVRTGRLFYAVSSIEGKMVYMHRFLVTATQPHEVDHINHDGLDNTRQNLRVATHQQNIRNARKRKGCTSRFKGVSFHAETRKWQAHFYKNGKSIGLGLFASEEAAALAYNAAASAEYGEFALLNEAV